MMKIEAHLFLVGVMNAGLNALKSDNIAIVEALVRELSFECVTVIVEDITKLSYNVRQKVLNSKIPIELTDHNDHQRILLPLKKVEN